MTKNEKLFFIFWILGAITLFVFLIIKIKSVDVDFNELPHIEIVLPDGYEGTTILNTGENGLFLLQGTRRLTNNDYENKIFLVSKEGEVLDEFQGSKHIGNIRNITGVGLFASDYSSSYVNGDIFFTISIKNNRIILDKMTNEKLKIFDSPSVKNISSSPNVSIKYKCYLSLDIVYGGCTYAVTGVAVDNVHISSSKYRIMDSTALDNNHTAVLLTSVYAREANKIMILGPRN